MSYNSNSDDGEYEEDDLVGSVNLFSSMFANIRKEKENKIKVQAATKKESERKITEEKESRKKVSESVSSKKDESKEEKLEKIRQEMKANMNLDELRLLGDIDDILVGKKISPKRPVPSDVVDIAEVGKKKTRQSKGKGRKKAKSPEAVKEPVVLDVDVDDEDSADVVTPLPPAKYLSFNVSWKQKTFFKTVNLYDKVSILRQEVSKSAETRAEDILLYFGEDILQDDMVLLDLGIKRGDTLEAMTAGKSGHANLDPAMLKLKCQTVNRRETFHIHIRKTTSLLQLRNDVAEKLGVAPEAVKLQFDGETLDLEETPESMDFEDGYCIDVYTS